MTEEGGVVRPLDKQMAFLPTALPCYNCEARLWEFIGLLE